MNRNSKYVTYIFVCKGCSKCFNYDDRHKGSRFCKSCWEIELESRKCSEVATCRHCGESFKPRSRRDKCCTIECYKLYRAAYKRASDLRRHSSPEGKQKNREAVNRYLDRLKDADLERYEQVKLIMFKSISKRKKVQISESV